MRVDRQRPLMRYDRALIQPECPVVLLREHRRHHSVETDTKSKVQGVFDVVAVSTLTLPRELQTLLGDYSQQSRSDLPRSEQRDGLRPKPFLGDLDQLPECSFAGIAEELDETRRFSQACAASKVVNRGAATRPPIVR